MENTLLNLIPAAYLPEIHLSQYDVGRTITFTLKDGASDYSVPSGASVKVKATKPSGFGFEVACTFNGGTVTLVTTDTMTPENGRFPAELSIVSGNTTIGTSNFIFNIERSPHPEGTIDGDAETIIPELTLLVERIEAAAEDVDEKAELFLNLSAEAETLPAGSLATANYSDGVLTLGIPRGYDGDDTKADAIVKTASGDVASFSDGGNGLLVKSLNVNITPKQSGSGDPSPSNVRPISGYDSVNVYRTGINITDEEWEVGSISTTGYPFADSERMRTKNFNPCSPSTQYYVLFPMTGNDAQLFYYDINKNFISGTAWIYKGVVTTPSNAHYIKMLLGRTYGTTYNNDISINYPSTDTEYHAYQGTSYPISLGQTVYGGTLEVCSGKLTINAVKVDMGAFNWAYSSTYNMFYITLYPQPLASVVPSSTWYAVCECYKYEDNILTTNRTMDKVCEVGRVGYYINDFLVRDTSFGTSTSDFKASVNGKYLVYKVINPTEITLTPTQVTTLLGDNNIWADSGTVEVEYRADTTLAYNELLSLIASL